MAADAKDARFVELLAEAIVSNQPNTPVAGTRPSDDQRVRRKRRSTATMAVGTATRGMQADQMVRLHASRDNPIVTPPTGAVAATSRPVGNPGTTGSYAHGR